MTKKQTLAIVGATGLVGETLLELLAEREFPVEKIHALASEKSAGQTVLFHDKPILVETLDGFDFSNIDIAFFAAGTEVSLKYAPIAAKAGCIVIDKSTAFRYDKDVPLVVPEVNPEVLKKLPKNIIANPNCNTIPIVAALKPIYDALGITDLTISTYQSVSGAGKNGVEALARETAAMLNGQEMSEFTLEKQIAFNVIPKIDVYHESGNTLEEMKLIWETQKIFDDKNIKINATAVRVPVFFGHSAVVHVQTKEPVVTDKIRELLSKAIGVQLCDEDYPTPVTHAANHDLIFVGRVRRDLFSDNAFNCWIVADNIRKGAALNAVQIAELLVQKSLYRH